MDQNRKCFTQKSLQCSETRVLPGKGQRKGLLLNISVSMDMKETHSRTCYLTLSGSVTAKLRSAEQAVSMLGSLDNATPFVPLRDVQH